MSATCASHQPLAVIFMKTPKLNILFFLLFAFSCKQNSDDKQDHQINMNGKGIAKNEFDYNCSQILISLYDNTIPEEETSLNYVPFSTQMIYQAKGKKMIDEFKQLTRDARRTGYHCCPDHNYTIAFYNGTRHFQNYYVDTTGSKSMVAIFEASYQFSYIIDKIKWRNFLTTLDKISFNEYFITDIKTAREVYSYTVHNDLPVINSNRTSKEWMMFDGDFKVKVAVVGEKLDEAKIYTNIKKAYPNDSFKIETISQSNECGSNDGHDCYGEAVLRIFCNKDFYDKFKIYQPKSFYDEAIPEFYVVGTRRELDKIDKLAEKEE